MSHPDGYDQYAADPYDPWHDEQDAIDDAHMRAMEDQMEHEAEA